MRSNHVSNSTLILLLCAALSMTGCQSTNFKKPDFSKLAFWKQNEDTTLPPPPARHFDPSRSLDAEEQVASRDPLGTLGGSTRSLDIDSDKLENLEIAASELSSRSKGTSPKRYSVDQFQPDDKPGDRALAIGADRIQSNLDALKPSAEGQLTSAQQDFQSAMESAKDTKESLSNDFSATLSRAQRQASNQFDATKEKVSGSLYDAAGRLVKDGESARLKSLEVIQEKTGAFQSQLESRLGKANQQAKDLQQSARDRIADVSNKTNDLMSRPLEGLKPQGNQDADSELAAMRRELQNMRQRYGELQQKLGDGKAQAKVGLEKAADTVYGSLAPMAQTQSKVSPRDSLAPSSKGSSNDFDTRQFPNPGATGNSLRPNPKPVKPVDAEDKSNAFPSTTHGGFRSANSQLAPASGLKPVGHVDLGNSNGSVRQAGGLEPISPSPSGGLHSATRIENHVDDVDIPEVILTGNGSYAPGSVNALKRR